MHVSQLATPRRPHGHRRPWGCFSDCFLSHKGATSSILAACASRAVLYGLCAIRLGPCARGGSAAGRPSTALGGAALLAMSRSRDIALLRQVPRARLITPGPAYSGCARAPRLTMLPLPLGRVPFPRPLLTAPSPALDAAGHQPPAPPLLACIHRLGTEEGRGKGPNSQPESTRRHRGMTAPALNGTYRA